MRTHALLIVLLLTPITSAQEPLADKPLGFPVPAVYPTPDGRHEFVLIPPRTDHPNAKESSAHQTLREKYTQSGLYRAGETTTPLWTVDWYSYDCYPANDAEHVVRVHGDSLLSRHYIGGQRLSEETIATQLQSPALSFYERGELVRTYALQELVTNPDALPHSVAHLLWMAGAVLTVDGEKFALTTQDSRQLFFDIKTGKILVNREAGLGNAQVWVIRISLALMGTAIIAILVGYFYITRKDRTA